MSRGLKAAFKAANSATDVQPFNLVHFAFDSGDIRLWTGTGELSWDGFTWTGAGGLLGFTTPKEDTEVKANGISISLSGMPAEVLSIALGEDYQGRSCTVYYGVFSAGAIVDDPMIAFRGKMDVMPIVDSGDKSTISITVENRLIILHRSRSRRWTDEDQKIDYPDDKGFEFLQSLQEKEIEWGPS